MLVHPKAWRELGNQVGIGPRGEVGAIQTDDGTVVDKRIADEFCKFFSSVIGVANNDDDDNDSVPSANGISLASNGEFRFHRIEEKDVLNLLKRFDINKASAVDQISARVLRMAAEGISNSLTSLFNSCLDTGQVSVQWKLANIFLSPNQVPLNVLTTFAPYHCCQLLPRYLRGLRTSNCSTTCRSSTSYTPHNQASDHTRCPGGFGR